MIKHYIKEGKKVTEYYVIINRTFKVNNIWFEIVDTRITGKGPMESTHKVKGPGGVKEMTHRQLINIHLKST